MESVNLVLTVPAIVALVTLGKSFGIAGKWAMLAAVVLGVVLNVADYYLAAFGAYQAATTGLLLGLAAAGLYDVAKTAAPTVNQ